MFAFSIATFLSGAITLFIAIAPLFVGGSTIELLVKHFRHHEAKSSFEFVEMFFTFAK